MKKYIFFICFDPYFSVLPSWRPCWACPSARWAWMTVRTQTAVSMEAAAARFHSARSRWLWAPVTSLWFRCRPRRPHAVAAEGKRWPTWHALPIPSTPVSTEASARMALWDTGIKFKTKIHLLCINLLSEILWELKFIPLDNKSYGSD